MPNLHNELLHYGAMQPLAVPSAGWFLGLEKSRLKNQPLKRLLSLRH